MSQYLTDYDRLLRIIMDSNETLERRLCAIGDMLARPLLGNTRFEFIRIRTFLMAGMEAA